MFATRIKKFSMTSSFQRSLLIVAVVFSGGSVCLGITVEEALKYVPVQKDAEYDRPSAKEVAQCKVKTEEVGGIPSIVVRGATGEMLRAFTDTNKDGRVDQWRYYQNGIESYRDMDTNYNGQADNHRWLGMAGMRWAVDTNEDGTVDGWKMISPEEISAEIVAAIRSKDVARFQAVLMTGSELKSLGLGKEMEARIQGTLSTSPARFKKAAASQRVVGPRAKWVHFSAAKPGVLPAGANGNANDIFIYENVAAMLEQGQVSIGTFIQTSTGQWRAIDIPISLMDEKDRMDATGFVLVPNNPEPPVPEEDLVNKETQRMVSKIDELDKAIRNAGPKEKKRLYEEQATLLRELASKAKTQKAQAVWIRQLAEMLGTAAQTGDYPEGVSKLERLFKELASQPQSRGSDLTGYVRFRLLTADYALRLQDPEEKNFAKIQGWWLDQLEGFVKNYPKGPDASEAMLQAAIAEEFAQNDKPALKWYERIVSSGAEGIELEKAKGARQRLTSVGKTLRFEGKTTDGKTLNVSQLKGKYVLIHYWATWCDSCLEDMKLIDLLTRKHKQFFPVGVNLDTDPNLLSAFLKKNQLKWPQIYEKGGLDSRPAVQLGIPTVPTMILIDDRGEVVSRNIHISELQEFLLKNLD